MKQSQKIGKINPILKIRIARMEDEIEYIDEVYGSDFESKLRPAYLEIKIELLKYIGMLVAQI